MRRPSPALLWRLVAGVLGMAVLAVSVPVAVTVYGVPLALAFVAGTGQAVALPLTLNRPVEATLVQFGAVALFALVMEPSTTWPLSVPGMIALILHVGLIGARHSWRTGLYVWWGSALLLILLQLVGRGSSQVGLIVYTTDSALLLLAAIVVRHWSGIRRQLADARRDVAVEQSQRAVAEERTRIARELHDVVAHSMSVIHMQATSASYRLKNADPESKEEFARIAAGARSAMREMRQLLSVLRDESASVSLAPVPGLSRLADLAASTRQAGVEVTLTTSDISGIPETVSTAAYRIVQESLSNVIRHAPGAAATVAVSRQGAAVEVTVENAPGGPGVEPSPGGGHGIPGMRERARLLGGTLDVGPLPGGGYRVAARLPLNGSTA